MDFKQGPNNQQGPGNQGPNFNQFQRNAEEIKNGALKSIRKIGIFFIIIAILLSLNSFIYIVKEDEVATVKEFGNITKVIVDVDNDVAVKQGALDSKFKDVEVVRAKGLFFKIPFITQVDKDTSKLLTYISNSANINTKDKIKYEIAMYAQWEITHPGLYDASMRTVTNANRIIDEVAYAVVIEKINTLSSNQFLTDKEALNVVLDEAILQLNTNLATKGIEIRDIEVYRTILPPSNIESTYAKMIAERGAIAQQKRSEGLEIYNNTVADTDREVAQIKADAIEEAETIKGEADASALEIYAEGFNRDPEFYEFWRTMKSYEETIDADTVIFLDKNNEYLKFFSNTSGN